MQGLSSPCLLAADFCKYASTRVDFASNTIIFETLNAVKPEQALLVESAWGYTV